MARVDHFETLLKRQIVRTLRGRIDDKLAELAALIFTGDRAHVTVPAPRGDGVDDAYWFGIEAIEAPELLGDIVVRNLPSIGLSANDSEQQEGDAEGSYEVRTTISVVVVFDEQTVGARTGRDFQDMQEAGEVYCAAVRQVLSTHLQTDAAGDTDTDTSIGAELYVLRCDPREWTAAVPLTRIHPRHTPGLWAVGCALLVDMYQPMEAP